MTDIDLRDTSDSPSNGQIGFLVSPVLDKDGAPDCAHDAIDGREIPEDEPREETKGGREHEEGEVGLCEGEVEGNLTVSARALQVGYHVAYLLA